MSPEVFLSERERSRRLLLLPLISRKVWGPVSFKIVPIVCCCAASFCLLICNNFFLFFSFFALSLSFATTERERGSLMCKLNGSFGFLVLFAQKHWRFALVLLGGHHRLPSRGSQVCSECSVGNHSQKHYFKVHQELIILMITQWTDWLSWVVTS